MRHNLYMRMERGDFGKLKDHQLTGIQQIIDRARGADHELEPSKVLGAIHELEKQRIELDLDPEVLGSIVATLSHGPEE